MISRPSARNATRDVTGGGAALAFGLRLTLITSAQSATPAAPRSMTPPAMALLALCCLIWGVGLVMVKVANEWLPPILNAALRSVAAGLILFVWVRWRGISLSFADGTFWPALVCALFFALEFIALYVGLAMTPVARATIFLHCAPFIAAAGEHFLVPGHRLTGVRLAGLVAAFAGLLIALWDGVAAVGPLTGDLLCLAGGVFWGLTTVVLKATVLRTTAPEKTLFLQLALSAPMMLAASVALGEPLPGNATPAAISAFVYTVLLVVVFGYSMWFWLMRSYSAASLHTFTFLTPLFGVVAGAVLLGESITPATLIGLAFVILGIVLVNRPSQ
jgi:drug/metabolite transporter (DMT)-like permease